MCKDGLLSFSCSLLQIERQAFEYTVNQLNAIYAEAEKAGCNTYCEGCMACLTAYLIYICTETHYEKVSTFVLFCHFFLNLSLGRVKWLEHDAPVSSTEVKNVWSFTSCTLYTLLA
jgi:hypothetical protein